VQQVADIVLADQLAPEEEDNEEQASPPAVDSARWAATFGALAGFYRDPRNDRPLHVWVYEGRARAGTAIGEEDDGTLLVPESETVFRVWPEGEEVAVSWEGGRPAALEMSGRRFEYAGPRVAEVDATPYLGTYASDEVATEYRIEAAGEQGMLALVHRKTGTRRFMPVYEDGFRGGGDWLTFHRGPDGEVSGFTWSNGRVWRVRFERVEDGG
jgi:hypothetical protein